MSPASQTGGLHVERYIGSYLISNSARNGQHKIHPDYDGCGGNGKASPKPPHYLGGHNVYHGGYVPADGLFCPPPFCQNRNNWAGVPLISTANHRRSGKPHLPAPHSPPYHQQRVPIVNNASCNLEYGDGQQIPLSKLALHTRGAPLILSRRYNNNGNRKQTQYQNNTRQFMPFGPNQRAPIVPDMVKKIKDIPKENRYEYKDHPVVSRTPIQNGHLVSNMDSLSVTSDESSGSAHSETCLPRIIKPRKRRKKDRKPLTNNIQEKGAASDGKHESNELTPDTTLLSLNPFVSKCHERVDINHNATTNYKSVTVNSNLLDYMKLYSGNNVVSGKIGDGTFKSVRDISQKSSEISDTRTIHRVDDVDDNESDDSSSLFEAISRCSPTICQCRYCDPSGQTWDIDQHCYSPLLTAPMGFDASGDKNPFSDKDSLLRRSWSEPCPGYSVENLRISDYDKRSTPHRSDPNIISTSGHQEHSGDPSASRSVGVIGAGRRITKSLDSPSTLDWKENTSPQSQLVPETLFKSSSSHGVSLEVSSAIVTSLNGHRDLEIKFFSTSPPAVVSDADSFVYPNRKESDEKSGNSEVSEDSVKCGTTNNDQSVIVQ